MFHMERLRGYYADQGMTGDRFEAIEHLGVSDMVDFDRRINALDRFASDAAARSVCDAHKRIRNILKRNADSDRHTELDGSLFQEQAEKSLFATLVENRDNIAQASKAGDYDMALTAFTRFADPLDRFFTDVIVMADDESLKNNRLALLIELYHLYRSVADISCLSLDKTG